MADVAIRPRTTDFFFMRRTNTNLGSSSSSSSERPPTTTDFSAFLETSAYCPEQRLNTASSLATDFNDDGDATQAQYSGGQRNNMLSEAPTIACGPEDGPISTAFQFPDVPATLLERAPEYEYSAHTRANVFAEGLPVDYAGLSFADGVGDVFDLSPVPAGYGSIWNQGASAEVATDNLVQATSYPIQGQIAQSSTSMLYGDQESLAVDDESAATRGYTQLSDYPTTHAFDTSQILQSRHLPLATQSYGGYYNNFTKASSDGDLQHQSITPYSNVISSTHPSQSTPATFNQFDYNVPSAAAIESPFQTSPSMVRSHNFNYGEYHLSKRMRAASGSSSVYSNTLPHSSPNVRQIYSSPAFSIEASHNPVEQPQAMMYNPSPPMPKNSLSAATSRTPSLSGPPGHLSARYGSSLQHMDDCDSDDVQSVPAYQISDWSDQYAPDSVIPVASNARSNHPQLALLAISGMPGTSSLKDRRSHPRSSFSNDDSGSATISRRRERKNTSGGGGNGSTDDDVDDNHEAPPPNPKAVALAEAATTRQSGTQAQQDCLQALNETMSQSLEQDGVARCPFPHCTKTFAKHRSYNLKTHLRSHSQLKPFACSSCPRAFSRKHDLERHARVHSGDRPYLCEVCGRGFPRSDALRRHWRVEKECGDKVGESDANAGSNMSLSTSQANEIAALTPLPFTNRSGSAAGSDGIETVGSAQVSPQSRIHSSSSGYMFAAEGIPARYDELQPQAMPASNTLSANGKRMRDEW